MPPRLPHRSLVVALALCLGTAGTAAAAPATFEFRGTGWEGGGFQNAVAVDPSGSGVVVTGGDVSGFHRSDDWGATWRVANRGIGAATERKVAAIAFHPTVPGRVYAGVGQSGSGGGFLVSADGGRSWAVRSTVPQFSADDLLVASGLPPQHPRSTGSLIAVAGDGTIYVATFSRGVMRSTDDGATWTTLGLGGTYLRALALDPAQPGVLYAATYGAGVFRTADAAAGGTFEALAASPRVVEDLAVVDGVVYAAAGTDGLVASADGGTSWSPLAGVPAGTWATIAGIGGCGPAVLYAGSATGGAGSVIRSLDGGATWSTPAVEPGAVRTTIAGPDGEPWWLGSRAAPLLGGTGYTAAHLALAPGVGCLPAHVFLAGRSGIWGSTDGGATWYPQVEGLAVTLNRAIAVDPAAPARVFTSTTDWSTLFSFDSGDHARWNPTPTGPRGLDVALDPGTTPASVVVGVGHRDTNTKGEVYSSRDPSAGAWTREGLGAAVGARRPLGVAVRRVSGARVLLAAVQGSGIWRKAGAGWTRVNATAMTGAQPTNAAIFQAIPATPVVFLFDRASGIWRSANDGVTWTKIWAKVCKTQVSCGLATDPSSPGRLYLSAPDGLYRLDAARTGTVAAGTIRPVRVGAFAQPGPIAVAGDGTVYLAQAAAAGRPAALFRSADAGATWTEIADDTYRATALLPLGLTLSPAGDLYVGLAGNGLLRGVPLA